MTRNLNMLITTHSVVTKASPEKVWNLYGHVWPEWDSEITWAKKNGSLQKGCKVELKLKNGTKANFIVTEYTENKSFTNSSHLPLTKMTFSHELMPQKDGSTRITHTVEMTGWLSWFFAFVIGRGFKKHLPEAIKKLAQMAEEI